MKHPSNRWRVECPRDHDYAAMDGKASIIANSTRDRLHTARDTECASDLTQGRDRGISPAPAHSGSTSNATNRGLRKAISRTYYGIAPALETRPGRGRVRSVVPIACLSLHDTLMEIHTLGSYA